MHENFVDYGKEVLMANESQRNKIEFLERERAKRDHLLADLTENLLLNKQTLREFNQLGPNSPAVDALTREAELLLAHLRNYYEEYQSINASLLVEQQMRLSDRQLYEERLVEFENKMVDLRKYLHDKEESFSSVLARLRRYEDLSEPTLDDKLQAYRKEIADRHVNEFIADIIRERNAAQRECENMRKAYFAFNEIKNTLIQQHEGAAQMLEDYEKDFSVKLAALAAIRPPRQHEEHPKWKALNPNPDLIRLLKKEKLSNQLLEGALNDAIDKNEELALANDLLRQNIDALHRKIDLLQAENCIFALRLADYDHHYCRAAAHDRKYYEEGEAPGLRYITERRLKEYSLAVGSYLSSTEMRGKVSEKLREEVEKWGRHFSEARQLKQEGLLRKSCSVPQLLLDFELEDAEEPILVEEV